MGSIKALMFGFGLVLVTTGSAFAVPITTGTLGMSFTFQAENAAGSNVALGSAVAIDFSALDAGAPSSANTGTFNVTQATGSFGANGIAIGNIGTIRDLIFSPFIAVSPFFTVGGVSFNLFSIVVSTQTDLDLNLNLLGTGSFVVGTDVTQGAWSFSAETTALNQTGTFIWRADASPNTAVIPDPSGVSEPATLALFGLGLLGLAMGRRWHRNI